MKNIINKNTKWGSVMLGAVLFVGVLTLTSGCLTATTGGEYGSVVTDGQKASIIKGKTTKVDILKMLGNPDQKIDLENNKEQFSYITETIKSKGGITGFETKDSNTEFWIEFDNGIVTDTGERPTTKQPNYSK